MSFLIPLTLDSILKDYQKTTDRLANYIDTQQVEFYDVLSAIEELQHKSSVIEANKTKAQLIKAKFDDLLNV